MMWLTDVPVRRTAILGQDARPASADRAATVSVFVDVARREFVAVAAMGVVLADAIACATTGPVLALGDRFQVLQPYAAAVSTRRSAGARRVARVAQVIEFVAGRYRSVGQFPHQDVRSALGALADRSPAVPGWADVALPRVASVGRLGVSSLFDQFSKRGHDVIIRTRKGN